jgi:hypothetical protein
VVAVEEMKTILEQDRCCATVMRRSSIGGEELKLERRREEQLEGTVTFKGSKTHALTQGHL